MTFLWDGPRDTLLEHLATDAGSQELAEHLAAGGTFTTFVDQWLEPRSAAAHAAVAEQIMAVIDAAGLFRGRPGLPETELLKRVRSRLGRRDDIFDFVFGGDVVDSLIERGDLVRVKFPGSVGRLVRPS